MTHIYGTDAERDKAIAEAKAFYEEHYGECAYAAIYSAMAEFRQRGLQANNQKTEKLILAARSVVADYYSVPIKDELIAAFKEYDKVED